MRFFNWLKSLFAKPIRVDAPDPALRVPSTIAPKPDQSFAIPWTGVQGRGRAIDPWLKGQIDEKMKEIFGRQILTKLQSGSREDLNWLVWAAAHAIIELQPREIPRNSNSGPLVSAIQDTVGGREAWPWCASFVQTAVAYAEGISGRPSALAASEHVWTMFHQSKQLWTGKPETGAIFCLNYPPGQSGHTGILWRESLDGYHTEEGNTQAGVDAQGRPIREGGGGYHCVRNFRDKPGIKMLGWLKAF